MVHIVSDSPLALRFKREELETSLVRSGPDTTSPGLNQAMVRNRDLKRFRPTLFEGARGLQATAGSREGFDLSLSGAVSSKIPSREPGPNAGSLAGFALQRVLKKPVEIVGGRRSHELTGDPGVGVGFGSRARQEDDGSVGIPQDRKIALTEYRKIGVSE